MILLTGLYYTGYYCKVLEDILYRISYLLNFLQLVVFEASIRFLSRRLASNFIYLVTEVLPTGEVQAA